MAAADRRRDAGPARRIGPGVDTAYRDELVERFALDLSKPAGTYSTGNRQKVALVAAFATRAPLLVLDEPTSGLDPLMEQQFRRAVREARDNGQTVFLSSHQLAEVEAVCDRVGILRAGRLVEVASVAGLRRLHRTEVAPRSPARHRTSPAVPGVIDGAAALTARRRAVHPERPARPGAARPGGRRRGHAAVREPSLEEIFLAYYGRTPMSAPARHPGCRSWRGRRRRTARPPGWRCARSAAAPWSSTVVSAGMSALVVATYAEVVGGPGGRVPGRAGRNPAIRTLFGEPVALDDAGGFTVWRTGTVLAVLLGVWAVLAPPGSRAGRRTPAGWICCCPACRRSPRSPGGTCGAPGGRRRHWARPPAGAGRRQGPRPPGRCCTGLALAAVGFFFVAVGGVAAQLFRPVGGQRCRGGRAGASGCWRGWSATASTALAWLRWLSPFGLMALARPFDTDRGCRWLVLAVAAVRCWPVVPVLAARHARRRRRRRCPPGDRDARARALLGSRAAFAVRCDAAAAGRLGRRDRRVLPAHRPDRAVDDRLPDGQPAVRRARRPGRVSRARHRRGLRRDPVRAARRSGRGVRRGAARRRSPATRRPAARPAARRPGDPHPAAGRRGGRHRGGVLALAVTVAGRHLGRTTATGAPLRLGDALAGASNILPIALLCLGAAVLALGWAPRASSPSGCCPPPAGSCQVLADSIDAPLWVGALSPFAHLAPVPGSPLTSPPRVMTCTAASRRCPRRARLPPT